MDARDEAHLFGFVGVDGATKAAESARAAGGTTTKAAKKLDRMGLSRRDTADVLGISHQRVQQLLAS